MMWKAWYFLSIFFNTVKKNWVPWKALRSEILPIFFLKIKTEYDILHLGDQGGGLMLTEFKT